jgi:hypothetical protein
MTLLKNGILVLDRTPTSDDEPAEQVNPPITQPENAEQ